MPCTSAQLGARRAAAGAAALSPPRRAGTAARRNGALAVRAFGPGNELKEGVEAGMKVKVTAPIKVRLQ
jgi:hypothetical protein